MNPARRLYNRIRNNKDLQKFELVGFLKGLRKGKTMDVSLSDVMLSIIKQNVDLDKAYRNFVLGKGPHTDVELKQAIADLRNVCGCAFLKLIEELEKRRG